MVTLADGTVITIAESASGRVGIAVYPWEIAVSLTPGAENAVPGTVASISPDRGRTRVRIVALVAEIASPDGLERGTKAYASFAPGSARIITRSPTAR
jgi:hypothetical protein